MNPSTHTFTTLLVTILLAAAHSNAADWQPGDIVVTDLSAPALLKVKSNTPVPIIPTNDLYAPQAFAVGTNGDLWVVDAPNRILRIDHRSGAVTAIPEIKDSMLQNVYGIAVATDGWVYVTEDDVIGPESEAGKVIRIDPATGAQTNISANGYFIDPVGIVVGPKGNLYITDVYSSGGAVICVDLGGGTQTLVSAGNHFGRPVGLTFDKRSGKLFVADRCGKDGPSIIRVDPANGTQTVVTAGLPLRDPFSVAVETNGYLLVADVQGWDRTGAIIRVHPVTGAQTNLVTGSGLVAPTGIATVPARVPLTCPCEGPTMNSHWANHGQYVTCVNRATKQWVTEGLITAAEGRAMLRQAGRQSCGR